MAAYSKTILLLSILCLSLSSTLGYSATPKKLHYYMGGGGEPEGSGTLFDGDVKVMADFLAENPEWQTTVSFNGGHSKTEDIIKTKMPNAKKMGDFTEANYNKMLDEMIRKIESGELKAGDQLMVTIDSHGARNSGGTTHNVSVSRSAATDLVNLSGSQTVNLDRLETLAKAASDRGVKLAILDASCFSGNLLNIKNDKVCLVSATGKDQYAYGGTFDAYLFKLKFTFSGNFVGSFKKGVNLEDAFLSARESRNTPDFPMISTPIGRSIDEHIYKMIIPYLKYNEDSSTNFTDMYSGDDKRKYEAKVCELNQNHLQLQNLLKQYQNMLPITERLEKNEFSDLISALESYRKYQMQYEKVLGSKFEIEQEVESALKKRTPEEKELLRGYSALGFLGIDFDKQIEYFQNKADHTDSKVNKTMWSDSAKRIRAQKLVVENIKASLSKNAKKTLRFYAYAFESLGATKYFANKVASEAKKVYLRMYKQQMKTSVSNPCRDFVL